MVVSENPISFTERGVSKVKSPGLTLVYKGPRRVEVAKGFDARFELHGGAKWMDGFWLDFGIRLMDEKEVCGRILWLGSNSSAKVVRRVSMKHRGLRRKQVRWIRSGFPLGLIIFRNEIHNWKAP